MYSEQAKLITIESKQLWQNSGYFRFLKDADREALLNSQIPFYGAVEAFPRLLLKLASEISDATARHLIVENIWEEHGQGDKNKFHIHTFKQHLRSLGFDGSGHKNPFVTKWLEHLFSSQFEALFHQLAAIEYMYAVISEDIAVCLQKMTLFGSQEHYVKHSALDWTHGEDLLKAMRIADVVFKPEKFQQAQLEFINLFEKLVVPTTKQLNNIKNSVPVNFYYTREASNVIDLALKIIRKNKLKVLAVCSGGENVIHYINQKQVAQVTAFDINPHQLVVCQQKLDPLQYWVQQDGKFEYLFRLVRSYFVNHHSELTIVEDALSNPELIDYVVDLVFNEKVLTGIFTEQATQYSTASFSEHFKQVYHKMLQDVLDSNIDNPNTNNVILGFNFPVQKLKRADQLPTFVNDNAEHIITKDDYDVIDLSNIGDWMPFNAFSELIINAYTQLTAGGCLILRRLLGDYQLSKLTIGKILSVTDDTGFYSETVIIKK